MTTTHIDTVADAFQKDIAARIARNLGKSLTTAVVFKHTASTDIRYDGEAQFNGRVVTFMIERVMHDVDTYHILVSGKQVPSGEITYNAQDATLRPKVVGNYDLALNEFTQ